MAMKIDQNIASPTHLRKVLESIVTDIENLQSWADTLRAKMNLDAGITDTDYAAPSAVGTEKGK